jgi:Tol biopolymer transport system component
MFCMTIQFSSCSDDPTDVIIPPWISPPPIDGCPRWSPSGDRILYYHRGIDSIFSDGNYTINPDSAGLWIINPDGTNRHLLLNTGSTTADWSPDGNWIAFSSNGYIYKARMRLGQVDTASIQMLTNDGDGPSHFPSWSPDGSWIAFDCTPENHDSIWRIRSDGMERFKIKDYARDPDYAPEGNRIVYLKWSSGKIGPDIYSMDLATKEEMRLTHLEGSVLDPEYSPDATRVVFSNMNICIINSDGTGLCRIAGFQGIDPSWSPSGGQIVFIKANSSDWNNHGVVFIMNDDGTGLRQLTRDVSNGLQSESHKCIEE